MATHGISSARDKHKSLCPLLACGYLKVSFFLVSLSPVIMSQYIETLLQELETLRARCPFMMDDATRSHLQLLSRAHPWSVSLQAVVHSLLVYLDGHAARKSGDRMAQAHSYLASPLFAGPSNKSLTACSTTDHYNIIPPPRFPLQQLDGPCVWTTYHEACVFVQKSPTQAFDSFVSFVRQKASQLHPSPAYVTPNTNMFLQPAAPTTGSLPGQTFTFGAVPSGPPHGQGQSCLIPQATANASHENMQSHQGPRSLAHLGPQDGIGPVVGATQPPMSACPPDGSGPMTVATSEQTSLPRPLPQQADMLSYQNPQLGLPQQQDTAYAGSHRQPYGRVHFPHQQEQLWTLLSEREAEAIRLRIENTSLQEENSTLKTENSALKAEIGDLRREALNELPAQTSVQQTSSTDDGEPYLSESCSESSSRLSPSQASSRDGRSRRADLQSGPCPNCSADHPLIVCPCPNTADGRLYACFDCKTTDHTWFQCEDYTHNEYREFYFVFVVRQGLCPVVHNVSLHKIWRNHFSKLEPETQELTLRRPGPLTPHFVLRMLRWHDGEDDPEIDRQMSEEQRLLPWELSKVKLFCFKERVKDTVLDPLTRRMSHEVFYEGTETQSNEHVEVIGAQGLGS